MKKLLFIVAILASLIGCQKESMKDINGVTNSSSLLMEGVSFENGMVKFKTQDIFDQMLNYLGEMEISETDIDYDKIFPNFISSAEAFDALTEEMIKAENGDMTKFQDYAVLVKGEDGDNYLEPVIDSKIFGNIANKQGVYQVGDKVIKTTRDFDYVMKASDYFDGISTKELNSIAKKHEIKRTENSDEKEKIWGYCSHHFQRVGNHWKRKMVGKFITRWASWAHYTEARIKTINYKRGSFGFWYRDTAYKIHHFGNGSYEYGVPSANSGDGGLYWIGPNNFSFNKTVYGKKELNQLIKKQSLNSSLRYIYGTNNGTHQVNKNNDSYGPATCYISF